MSPYEVLGIEHDATPEQIELAFRRASAKWHPDRVGDDPAKQAEAHERMVEINEAYKILTDGDRRGEFDEHGSADQAADSIPALARKALKDMFLQFLDQDMAQETNADPFDLLLRAAVAKNSGISTQAAMNRRAIRYLETIRKRIRRRDGRSPSMILSIIDRRIQAARESIKESERQLEVGTAVLALISQYEFEMTDKERERMAKMMPGLRVLIGRNL